MKVVIVGCGWLGAQLAGKLAAAGYQVYGTRRSAEGLALLPDGVTPLLLDLSADISVPAVHNALRDAVVICAVPPGLRSGNGGQYLQALQRLAELMQLAGCIGVIHFSSSGIYQGLSGMVDETASLCTEQPRVATLYAGEKVLQVALPACITLRLSGLFGAGRAPGRFVAGKTLPAAGSPVNMLHADDVYRAVLLLLQQPDLPSGTYNLSCPHVVTRQQFYQHACSITDTAVSFSDEAVISHHVSAQSFITKFAFQYRFSSAIDGLTYCN